MHHTLNNEDELERIEQAHERFFMDCHFFMPMFSEITGESKRCRTCGKLEEEHPNQIMNTPTNTPRAISMQPVESSQIHSIGYDPESKTMAVTFLRMVKGNGPGGDKKRGPGATYHYQGVTPEQHKALMDAPSKYSHFHANKATAFAKFTKVS